MACNFLAPNGEKSVLYAALEQRLGEDKATQMWNLVHSEEYQKAHPDLAQDVNGEPTYAAVMQAAMGSSLDIKVDTKEIKPVKITAQDFDKTSLESFNKDFDDIIKKAEKNPTKTFLIEIGSKASFDMDGVRYQGATLANLMDRKLPANVQLHDSMQRAVNNLPKHYIQGLMLEESNPLDFNKEAYDTQMKQLFVEIHDDKGPTGKYFSAEAQNEITDSILSILYNSFNYDPTLSAAKHADIVLANLKHRKSIFSSIAGGTLSAKFPSITVERAAQLVKSYDAILNSFFHPGENHLWGFALTKLSSYGITVKMSEPMSNNTDTLKVKDENGNDKAIEMSAGQGLRDFYDNSFEMDTMDTASTRMKMFLMAIPKSKLSQETAPQKIDLMYADVDTRDAIRTGRKTQSFRTAEQAEKLGLKVGTSYLTKIEGEEKRVTVVRKLTAEQAAELEPENGKQPAAGDYEIKVEKYVQRKNILQPEVNSLGMPKLAPFQELFQKLTATLHGKEVNFEAYMQALKATKNPEMHQVANKLESSPKHLQNEFTAVMSTQYQRQQMILFTKRKNGSIETQVLDSNQGSEAKTLQTQWQEAQKDSPILITGTDGITRVNKAIAAELWNDLKALNTMVETKENKAEIEQKKRALIKRTLESNGIVLDPRAIDDLMDGQKLRDLTKGTKLNSLFGMSKDNNPDGIISAIIAKLYQGDSEKDQANRREEDDVENYKASNPLYTEGSAMSALAELQVPYSVGLFTATSRNAEGKSVYAFGLNTSLSHAVREIKNNPQALKRYDNVPFARNAWLLTKLKGVASWHDKFTLAYLDGIKNRMGIKPGSSRSDMSDREQQLMALGLFQNKNDLLGHYLSLTHSDKTTTPVLMNVPKETNLRSSDGKFQKHIIDTVFKSVFMSEYDRINSKADSNLAKYDKGKQLFYFLPLFNYDVMAALVDSGKMEKELMDTIWADKGQLSNAGTDAFRKAVNKLISRQLNEMTNLTLESWKDSGLLDSGLPGSKEYLDRLMISEGYRQVEMGDNDFRWYNAKNEEIHPHMLKDIRTRAVATDYTVNSFLVNTSMAQMFYGDPALLFKKNQETTLAQYSKRLAKDIAPGRDGNFSQSPAYTTVTAAEYNPFVKELANIKAYQGRVEASDAQEFVTVQEHLNVLLAYGKITESQYTTATNRIAQAGPGGYYTLEGLDIPMHPMKPVAAGLRDEVNGVMSYDYIKSSAIPLYPPLIAGLELDKLRIGMEKGKVDRLNFLSAKKIGAPVKPVSIWNNDTGVIDPTVFESDDWKNAQQSLDRTEFRIQQETPYDESKEAIRTVSQMNKLLTQGIALVKTPFKIGNQEFDGNALRTLKEGIRKQLIQSQFNDFLDSVGAVYDKASKSVTFTDKKKLYDLLKEEALNRSGYTINDLAALQSFIEDDKLSIPLMFTPSASRFEGLMMSMFRNLVNVKMPGKSYVQATPAGFKSMQTWEESNFDKSAIVWVKPQSGELQTIHSDEDGNSVAAQVLVPWNFFNQHGGEKLDINRFMLKKGDEGYQEGKRLINPKKVPQELLQLIGARIPNQKHSSMLPIEIAGFLPDSMGDTIVVPAAITKQMGSDFDVDKLYTYKRSYTHKDGVLSIAKHDAAAVFEANQEKSEEENTKAKQKFETKQEEARIADLKNQYMDIHWAVLMHPEMLSQVTAPLDIADLAEEADKISELNKTDKQSYYFSPAYQLADFQSMKAAKSGVGTSSLAVTNNAVVEDKNLSIADAYGKGITVLDREGNTIELTHLSGYGVSFYQGDNNKKRSKSDNLVVQQNENVDNANNTVVGKINLNEYTSAASYAMSRLQTQDGTGINEDGTHELAPGKAIDLEYNAKLLSQPIIKQFVAEMAKMNDGLTTRKAGNAKQEVFMKLRNQLGNQGASSIAITPIGPKELAEGLKPKPGKEYAQLQLNALDLFERFDSVGDRLTILQTLTTQDTRGAGESMLDSLETERKRYNFDSDAKSIYNIRGARTLFESYGNTTEVGETFNSTVLAANDLYSEDLPYAKMTGLFDYVLEQSGREDLGTEMKKKIFTAMKSYAFSHTNLSMWKDAYAERARLMFSLNGNTSLAERVQNARKTWAQNNYFLQRLVTNIDPDNLKPHTITYDAAKAANVDDLENNRAWLEMLGSENAEIKKLGEDLVKYAFLTGGVQGTNNFVKYLPFSYLEGTSIASALRETSANLKDFARNKGFRTQFFQHNPEAAKQLSYNFAETGNEYEFAPDQFSVPAGEPAEKLRVWITPPGQQGRWVYPDFLSHRGNNKTYTLYAKAKNFETGEINYYKIDTLGNKNMTEYSVTAGIGRSVDPVNRSRWWAELDPEGAQADVAVNNLGARLLNMFNPRPVGLQIGLKGIEGNMEEITEAFHTITADEQQPSHIRVMAELLSQMQRPQTETLLSEMLQARKGFTWGIDVERGGAIGSYSATSNRLTLTPTAFSTKQLAGEVLVHEMVHYHSSLLMLATESDATLKGYGFNPTTYATLQAMKWRMNNMPVLMDKIKALHEIRLQAAESVKRDIIAQFGEDEYNERYERVIKNKQVQDVWDKLIYGTHSNTEFISHVMSSPEVIKYLNEKQYDGDKKSLLDIVKEAFVHLWGAFLDSIGANKGSMLEESLRRSLDVMLYRQGSSVSLVNENMPNFSAMYDEISANNLVPLFDDDVSGEPTLEETHANSIAKIVGKLQEQLKELKDSRTDRTSREERIDKDRKIAAVEDQIQELRGDADLLKASEVGRQQLSWVLEVAKKANPSVNELNTAIRIGEMWAGIVKLLYSGDANSMDEGLKKLSGDAQEVMHDLIAKAQGYMVEASKGVIRPSVDFKPNELQDLDILNSNTRSLTSAATSRVLQFVGQYIENTSNRRDEEIRNAVKKLRDLEKRMLKSVGGNKKALQEMYNRFMQNSDEPNSNAWGITNEFSGNWFNFLKRNRNQLRGELANLQTLSGAALEKEKNIQWAGYWAKMKTGAAFVNTAKFFDALTGELRPRYQEDLKELEDQVGADYARIMLDEAKVKYAEYLEEKNAVFARIDAEVANEGKDPGKAKAEKDAYLAAYSPNGYFRAMNSANDRIGSLLAEKYTVVRPKSDMREFFDKRFASIMDNDVEREFYSEYTAFISEMKSYLPTYLQHRLGDTFLPIVAKNLVTDALDFPALIKGLKNNTIKGLTSSDWEVSMSNAAVSRIPLDFIKEGKVAVGDRSTDLARIGEMFAMMALHYKHFSQAKDFIQMSQQTLQHIHNDRIGGSEQHKDASGKLVTTKGGLENALKALQFLVDHSMLKKPKKLEGVSGTQIFSEQVEGKEKFSLRRQGEISKRVRELIAQKEALDKKYVNQDMTLDEYEAQKEVIDNELNKYQGYKLTGSKFGDKLVGINQMKALAFNPFSAVANMAFGVVSTFIHAAGQADFTSSEATSAFKVMLNSTAKWVTFGTKESEITEKILNTFENLGVMGDYVEGMYGKGVELHADKAKWKQLLDPFAMMRSSDYFMKGMSSMAVMMHQKVEVTVDGVKKTISLWDAMNKEGKWDSEKYGPHPGFEGGEDWDKLRNRISKVNMVLHGNQNKNSPRMAQQTVFLRMLGQFRMSWLPEGFYNRFQDERYDISLERNVKGRYRTLADLGIMGSLNALFVRSIQGLAPGKAMDFSGLLLPNGKDMSTSAVDVENMRRNIAEMAWLMGVTAMILALRGLKDDDEPNPMLQVVLNMLMRGQQDLELYASPAVFDTVTRNPIPITQVFKDYYNILPATNKLIMGDSEDFGFDDWLLKLTKAGLPIPQAALINKTKFMFEKDLGDMHQ